MPNKYDHNDYLSTCKKEVFLLIFFCRKIFTDFTTEENNFLVVVYGLTNIVYPLIQNEFSTQCPDHVLKEIRTGISEQQNAKYCKGSICSSKDVNKSRKERMYLTKDQQRQLLPTSEFITSKIMYAMS